jgi:hypothetical protein
MRRAIPFAVCLAVLVGLAAVALAQVGGTPPARAAAIETSGAFEISNSAAGQPVLAANEIAPGDSATGTVTIEDPGSETVGLTLERGELIDQPAHETPGRWKLAHGRERVAAVSATARAGCGRGRDGQGCGERPGVRAGASHRRR